MYDKDSKGISYLGGFFILICFAIGGLVVGELISKPIYDLMTAKSKDTIGEAQFNANVAMATKVRQAITFLIGFFLSAVLTAFMLHRKPFQLLGFVKGTKLSQAGLTILILGTSLLVAASLSHLTHIIPIPQEWKLKFDGMEKSYTEQIANIIQLNTITDYILALIVLGFVPALCEETVFRGGLQNFLTRGTGMPWVSIILVSILFSLSHFSFYLFLSRFFLGIALGALFRYSGNLWLCIIAHFLNNAITITILYVMIRQGKTIQQAMESDGGGSAWGLLALPAFIGLMLLFKRVSPQPRVTA